MIRRLLHLMIKAEIFNVEIVLQDGVFRSDNAELLKMVEILADDFDRRHSTDYFPNYQFEKMKWITDKLKGSITHYDEIDYSQFPPDVCF